MTSLPLSQTRLSLPRRLWGAIAAVWGAFVGLLPHVLHHIGPLAGAAILAGTTGRLLFLAIGSVASVPLLRRLYRRFATWKAPAIALAIFALMFSVSSFVIGPALTGSGGSSAPSVSDQKGGHASHHP